MRASYSNPILTAILCALFFQPLLAAERGQPKRKTAAATAAGVTTPGVQIPIETLKPEAELALPSEPAWIYFAESVFIPTADHLERIDPKTAKPTPPADPSIAIAKSCAGMVSAFGSLWLTACPEGALARWDVKTKKESARLASGIAAVPHAVTASTDSIWLLTDTKTTISRVDPDQNAVVGELRVPAGCHHLTFGEAALWLVCPSENKVYRIDPATNLVANQIEVSELPDALAVGEGSVWVLCRKLGKLERIDPKTNKVVKSLELGTPGIAGEIAVGEGSVWVTMAGFPLTRISPQQEKERVVQQFHGKGGGAITTSKEAIWLVNTAEKTVWKIDPKRVAATLAE